MMYMSTMEQISEKARIKRKSERLGWKSRSERDVRPLCERIGEGRRVYADTRKSNLLLVP